MAFVEKDIKINEPDLILKVNCFNLKYTLECGQCFRWKNYSIDDNIIEDEYIGVIEDRVIRIKQVEDMLYIYSNSRENLEEVVTYYFDLNSNYNDIEKTISKVDENVFTAVKNSTGIRILNQAPFETLISYIISANNNIPRISRSVNDISRKYGKKITFENNDYYLFPTVEELEDITEEEFRRCGVGFRARYIKHTVEDILTDKISLYDLQNYSNEDMKKKLLTLQGVGPKVADCIMLFAYDRKDIFPIDVWVKRVMEKLYFKKNVSLKDILIYSKENFGKYAGIIQQHLFYNIRENMM